jgi:outer membrane protein OmpA-like peptidoglycan-associated protein
MSNRLTRSILTIIFLIVCIYQSAFSLAVDTIPLYKDVPVIIPFEFKQSTLNYENTFRRIDSVAQILLANDSILLSVQGYAHPDEGIDTICYWLSLNRALAVKSYLNGRGIDSLRIWSFEAVGNKRKQFREPKESNYAVELVLRIPLPPPVNWKDFDGDGIADKDDKCPDKFGYPPLLGCPDSNAIIIPFEPMYGYLSYETYKVLDSVVVVLKNKPGYQLRIEGHAYKTEGVDRFCKQLAQDRAEMVKRYLLSRNISEQRIISLRNMGKSKAISAGRNPMEIAKNSRAEIYLIKPGKE